MVDNEMMLTLGEPAREGGQPEESSAQGQGTVLVLDHGCHQHRGHRLCHNHRDGGG